VVFLRRSVNQPLQATTNELQAEQLQAAEKGQNHVHPQSSFEIGTWRFSCRCLIGAPLLISRLFKFLCELFCLRDIIFNL
jgi:hypothetical protein